MGIRKDKSGWQIRAELIPQARRARHVTDPFVKNSLGVGDHNTGVLHPLEASYMIRFRRCGRVRNDQGPIAGSMQLQG